MLKNYIHQLLKFFYPPVKKLMPYQVYAYLAVGTANTLLNIGLFAALYLAFATSLLAVEAATVISFVVTVMTGFWLNKNFAFTNGGDGKKEKVKQFGKYGLVALQGQCSAYLLTKGMIVLFNINASVAYFITAVIMLTLNYFLQKYFTFRRKKLCVE